MFDVGLTLLPERTCASDSRAGLAVVSMRGRDCAKCRQTWGVTLQTSCGMTEV